MKKYTYKTLDKIWEEIHNITIRRKSMETIIIDRDILPETIFSYIHSPKIKVIKENGNIVLTPVNNKPNINELRGMFSDGKLSSEAFIKQKVIEKEMEN